jgi:type VI secretion system secreted protein Hcp
MAVNAYLKIEGINGPSTSKEGCIDVLSFSFGSTMQSNYGPGASGKEARSGRAAFSDLSIMKVTDKTSPLLFDHCVTGNIIPTVTLYYDKPVGDEQQDYFKIELKDAMLTSHQLSGSAENPTESISFAFQRVEVAYAAEKDDGTLDAFVPKAFDLATLKAA